MGSLDDHQNEKEVTTTSKEEAPVVIVMVPFPAQGHLNQLLQLSCLISSYGHPVHYIGSAIHNRQAKVRANCLTPSDIEKIHFNDLPIRPFDSPPPKPNLSSKFPIQLQPAWYASLSLREPIANYVKEISSKAKRVVVIHDPLMAVVVQDVVSIPNTESYVFNCVSAFSGVFFLWKFLEKPFPFIPKELPTFEGIFSDDIIYLSALQNEPLQYRTGDLYNTCRLLEGPYLDLLSSEEVAGNRRAWAIGPIPAAKLSSPDKSENRHQCLDWLDKQEPKSVLYMAFGTTTSLSDEEIEQLALGLEQSKQKFLWVLRDADKGDVFDGEVRRAPLPEGFEERLEGVGLVIRDWAPQLEILAHPATGGFMSHCGWNSCIESITMGVPIAAWPMHSDQPFNTVFITEMLKVGLVVREWNQRTELVKASTVEHVVKRLMASEEGYEIQKRAEKLSAVVRQATSKGGESQLELDSFIAHITR